jgi:hypothetical protein
MIHTRQVAEERKCFNRRMSGVEFSAKELKELVVSSVSCVRVQRRVRHMSLLPKYLLDTKSAINTTLNAFQNKFDIM